MLESELLPLLQQLGSHHFSIGDLTDIAQSIRPPNQPFPADEFESSAGLSRRQFLRVLGVMGVGLMAGAGKRLIDLESQRWQDYAYPLAELKQRAAQYPKKFLFGLQTFGDYERETQPWTQAERLRQATGREDRLGYFFSLEDVDNEAKMDTLLKFCWQAHARGTTPMINLHMWSRPNKKHPFDRENFNWLEQKAAKLAWYFRDIPFDVEVRLFYEMNIPLAFEYGRWGELSDKEHAHNFQHIARLFKTQFSKYHDHLKILFSPSALHDFSRYATIQSAAHLYAGLGVDGYDIFPGGILPQILAGDLLENILERLASSLYFYWGRKSPELVFEPSFNQLKYLANGQIPFYMYEFGSKQHDGQWLVHAMYLLAAMGGDGAFLFTINKEAEVKDKPFENQWVPPDEEVAAVGEAVRDLNQRAA